MKKIINIGLVILAIFMLVMRWQEFLTNPLYIFAEIIAFVGCIWVVLWILSKLFKR